MFLPFTTFVQNGPSNKKHDQQINIQVSLNVKTRCLILLPQFVNQYGKKIPNHQTAKIKYGNPLRAISKF